MNRLPIVFVLLPLICAAEHAGLLDDEIVSLGRVFTTQEQRSWLDQRRGMTMTPADEVVVEAHSDPVVVPVGIIIPADGQPSVWRNGDFVKVRASDLPAAVRVEGDMVIQKHAVPAGTAGPGNPDPEPAADAERYAADIGDPPPGPADDDGARHP